MKISIPPKKLIAQSFSRKASRYRSSAFIQRIIVERCMNLIQSSGGCSGTWLDAGSGIGLLGAMILKSCPKARLYNTDLAFGSLALAKLRSKEHSLCVQSDMDFLPYQSAKFDGVAACSVLHWLPDMRTSLTEMNRVLKPGGRIALGMFLEGSFLEIRALREKTGLPFSINLADETRARDFVRETGFVMQEFSLSREIFYFLNALDVLKYLSDIGSTAKSGKHLSRAGLSAFCREYQIMYGNDRGVPLTCCVGLGIARKRETI